MILSRFSTSEGVGQLVQMGTKRPQFKTKLKVGICGEHGGEPSSVEFCHMQLE
jgi:pyruvate, orthophosphate dikinase